jgi:hypothetical protein
MAVPSPQSGGSVKLAQRGYQQRQAIEVVRALLDRLFQPKLLARVPAVFLFCFGAQGFGADPLVTNERKRQASSLNCSWVAK